MESARTEILRKLRRAQNARIDSFETDQYQESITPTGQEPGQTIGQTTEQGDDILRFCQQAVDNSSEIIFVDQECDLGQAIKEHIKRDGHTGALHCSNDALFRQLSQAGLDICYGPCNDHYQYGLARARSGIAETGTLALLSTDNLSTAGLFLPAHSLVVLRTSDIVGRMEDFWQLLNCRRPPHSVNLVSGPSRTGDIDQSIHIGAHGSCRLSIFLVN